MNFESIKKVFSSPYEVVLFLVFLAFYILPITIPGWLSVWINSSIGLAIIVMVTIYMFLYYSPILGISTIIVAYEILRRSSIVQHNNYATQPYKFPIEEKTTDTISRNVNEVFVPFSDNSLEEEVISKDMPIGQSPMIDILDNQTSFLPVVSKTHGSSSV